VGVLCHLLKLCLQIDVSIESNFNISVRVKLGIRDIVLKMPNYLGPFGFQYEGLLLLGRRTRTLGQIPVCVPTVDTSVSSAPLPTLPSSRRDSVRKNFGGDNTLIKFVRKSTFVVVDMEQRGMQINIKRDRESEA
jgi:hypothetical protein